MQAIGWTLDHMGLDRLYADKQRDMGACRSTSGRGIGPILHAVTRSHDTERKHLRGLDGFWRDWLIQSGSVGKDLTPLCWL